MTKIKLANGVILNAISVELVNGVLKIATTDHTVEELAALFADKSNTSLITLLTKSGVESGFKTGFTSFAGITYGVDGVKTVELFQPKDVTEARISNAEAAANLASANAASANSNAESANSTALDANKKAEELESSIIDTQLAMAELAEILTGGI